MEESERCRIGSVDGSEREKEGKGREVKEKEENYRYS